MKKRCIASPNGPPAKGPYSPAVAAGNMLFVSGQGPLTVEGEPVRGTVEEETRLTLANLKTVLEDAGSGLDHVVKVTAFLADMNNFAAFNGVYQEFFASNPPARSCIEVARLPLDFQVEVEAIAVLPD